ncbi:mechanosensitive ion channel [Candidatus Sumerlaeota bacterium]|nr:mechanosensitive ion channel [Candidatus Sumerlaeota bacterium]
MKPRFLRPPAAGTASIRPRRVPTGLMLILCVASIGMSQDAPAVPRAPTEQTGPTVALDAETEEEAPPQKHALLLPSTTTFWLNDLKDSSETLLWLTRPQSWYRALVAFGKGVNRDRLPAVLQLLPIGLLFSLRPRLRRWLEASGKRVQSARTDSFLLTLGGVAATLAIALAWPAAIWFIARRLAFGDPDTELPAALGAGLGWAALLFLTLQFPRVCLRDQGLATLHFRWDLEAARALRGLLTRLGLTQIPLVALVATLDAQSVAARQDSLGRLFFVVSLAIASFLVAPILSPSRPFMTGWSRLRKDTWLVRARYSWYPFVFGAPLLLAALAAFGYYYTAKALGWHLLLTLWLAVALLFLDGLMARWLFVARRRLALEEYRKRREAAAQEAAKQAEGKATEEEGPEPEPEPKLDIPRLSEQTRHIMEATTVFVLLLSLWFIWVDFLPALTILGNIVVWPALKTTLADLLLALAILVATVVASRNIPGLLEIGVLARFPLERGTGYAITTLSRYTILAVGIVAAFSAVKIVWENVQWLAAAFSVGLGFGLQEIFANFVSGLIILFERPVRVGDTVTLGDVTGVVTRIRMRATTVIDWDRKELIVPNKEFITGRLVNWTLSDTILRVVIPVGIAYGSNVPLARELLLRVAKENPLVLDDPEPTAMFAQFGGSSLDFELRVYIPNSRAMFTIRDELNSAIDDAFRKADIEIAFPQHDIHIRSIQADLPVVHKGGKV